MKEKNLKKPIKEKITQKQIWNLIAKPWKKFRTKPIPEVQEFLFNKKGKVLDIGCGSGRNFIENKKIKIYGIDFSEEMIKYAKKYAKEIKINANLFKCEAENLIFDNNYFDAAIFIAVLHCIKTKEKRKKSLQELFRVLKPKAEAMITVWDKNQPKFKDFPKENFISWTLNKKKLMRYYYIYEKQELANLLKKIGFKIIKIYNCENKEYSKTKKYSKKNIIAIVKKP